MSVIFCRLQFGRNISFLINFIIFNFRNATPLLCYPPSLVEQKLKELETSLEKLDSPVKEDSLVKLDNKDSLDKRDDRLLNICLYFIEREFNFTSDGLFTGSHLHHFSPELKSEIDKYRESETDKYRDSETDASRDSETDASRVSGNYISERQSAYNKGLFVILNCFI